MRGAQDIKSVWDNPGSPCDGAMWRAGTAQNIPIHPNVFCLWILFRTCTWPRDWTCWVINVNGAPENRQNREWRCPCVQVATCATPPAWMRKASQDLAWCQMTSRDGRYCKNENLGQLTKRARPT